MDSPFQNPPSDTSFEDSVRSVRSTQTTFIVLGVVGGIISLCVTVAVIYWIARTLQKSNIRFELNAQNQHVGQEGHQSRPEAAAAYEKERVLEKQTVEMFLEYIQNEKPVRFTSQQIAIFTRNYFIKLGSGGFGHVYKGELPNGVPLAVKVLNNNGLDKRMEEQFMAEVGTIGRTYHRNLVRLYGFCFDAKIKALVYEFMENGSLDKLLFGNKNQVSLEKLHEIAIGTARGLEYMHQHSQKTIIHYDIKPGNILLDSDYCPKIADFGLAKLYNRDNTYRTCSGFKGTPGYAAPELWLPLPVTYKCDVYSYGMMLFEIVGRRRNLDNNSNESQEWFPKRVWEKYEKEELQDIILDMGIEEKDMSKVKTMFMVALWCAQYTPDARPTMSTVVQYLEGGFDIPTPPNPFQHLLSTRAQIPSQNSSNSTADKTTDTSVRDDTPVMRNYEIEIAKETS